jgi:hypothetical protein
MSTRIWIKLYIEMLEDPQVGKLSDTLWRRAVELFLLAGRVGNDGRLPPVSDLAWRLRVPVEELTGSLKALAEAGVVHESGLDGNRRWYVSHFAERQSAMPVVERVRQFRARQKEETDRYENGNEEAEVVSTSTSDSISTSDSLSASVSPAEQELRTESDRCLSEDVPASPGEAMLHPDVQVFAAATGGRIPSLVQYRAVIESIRLLRARNHLDDQALTGYLAPYWQAWRGRRRKDGRPYDPANISWLTEWALNGTLPPETRGAGATTRKGKTVEEQVQQFLNGS